MSLSAYHCCKQYDEFCEVWKLFYVVQNVCFIVDKLAHHFDFVYDVLSTVLVFTFFWNVASKFIENWADLERIQPFLEKPWVFILETT